MIPCYHGVVRHGIVALPCDVVSMVMWCGEHLVGCGKVCYVVMWCVELWCGVVSLGNHGMAEGMVLV